MGNCCGKKGNKKNDNVKEQKELRTIFSEFDTDGDGFLTQVELSRALKRLGLSPTSLEVNAMFSAADTNRDGRISFDEFEQLMKASPALRSLQRAFQEFDLDGDGYISEDEMRKVISQLGQNLSDTEVRSMFRHADTNSDGRIDFEEFAQMMKRHPLILNLREVFRQFDVDNDGYISEAELRVVINQLAVGASEREIKTMFQAADKNDDGRISFEEFAGMLSQKNR